MTPGTRIDRRFEIERVAGSGGMGTVYRARDHQAGRVVALKVLLGQSQENASRFLREASLLAELGHPGIVGFVASGSLPDGAPYLVMDWLEGESLSQRLERGPLGVAETVELGLRVAEALGYAHARGVIHRDLKPGNLFLSDGDPARPLILDFGIARVTEAGQTITRTGAALGSPGYMAPEQARGQHGVDNRADLFSLGCVLFRCLAGEAPFTGEPLAAMLKAVMDPAPLLASYRPDIPPPLEALIQALLAKSKEARPRDAAAVGEALAAVAAGLPHPISAKQPSSLPQPSSAPTPLSADVPRSANTPAVPASRAPVSAATAPPATAPFLPPPAPRTGTRIAPIALSIAAFAAVAAVVVVVVLDRSPVRLGAAKPSSIPCTSTRCEDIAYPDPAHVDPLDLWKRVVPLAKEVDATATFTGLAITGSPDGTVALVGDPRQNPQGRSLVFSFVTKSGRGLDVAALPGRLIVNESLSGKPIPYPACKPRDAYRAAIASGAPRGVPASLIYTQVQGAPEWSFWIPGRPETMRRIDGTGTCPIKWKPPGK